MLDGGFKALEQVHIQLNRLSPHAKSNHLWWRLHATKQLKREHGPLCWVRIEYFIQVIGCHLLAFSKAWRLCWNPCFSKESMFWPTCAMVLCTATSQQGGSGFDSSRDTVVMFSPGPLTLRWVISQAFQCGVCMFSPCSTWLLPQRTSIQKHAEQNRLCEHLGTTDRAARCSLFHLEEGQQGWQNAENTFLWGTLLQACVCSQCHCSLHTCHYWKVNTCLFFYLTTSLDFRPLGV